VALGIASGRKIAGNDAQGQATDKLSHRAALTPCGAPRRFTIDGLAFVDHQMHMAVEALRPFNPTRWNSG
jgi:hypothetical protein